VTVHKLPLASIVGILLTSQACNPDAVPVTGLVNFSNLDACKKLFIKLDSIGDDFISS